MLLAASHPHDLAGAVLVDPAFVGEWDSMSAAAIAAGASPAKVDAFVTGFKAQIQRRYGLGASAIAPPISYALDGVQYIAIMVGNGGGNGEGASNGTDVRVSGRLLAFRLGGTATLARYSTRNRAFVDFTAAEASDGDPAAGGIYFGRYCTVCHQANFIYPNLRQSYAPLSKSRFQAVVHDGAMQSTGMASFSRFLDPQQVEAIRAYLLVKYSTDPHRPSPSSHN